MKKKILAVALATAMLGGCQTMGQKEGFGLATGGILGGLAGSHIGKGSGRAVATTAGVFIGALMGREVGSSLDRADEMYASRAFTTGLENNRNGSVSRWDNPNSGASGYVTPVSTYQKPSGQYCREYQNTVTVGGKTQSSYGQACRRPDGSWEIGK